MAKTPYDLDLDRNPANFQPLTPLLFLERAAAVHPEHVAIVHGPLRRNYRDFYARARRLASALRKRGIGRSPSRPQEGIRRRSSLPRKAIPPPLAAASAAARAELR